VSDEPRSAELLAAASKAAADAAKAVKAAEKLLRDVKEVKSK